MKIILNSILKRKIPYLLLGIQVVLTIAFFISIICSIQGIFYLDIESQKINCKTSDLIQLKISGELTSVNNSSVSYKKLTSFIKKVKETTNVKSFIFVRQIPFEVKNYFSINDLIKLYPQDNKDETKDMTLSAYGISQDFLKFMTFDMCKGRYFQENDFVSVNNEAIPILAGYDFAKHNLLDVGSVITGNDYDYRTAKEEPIFCKYKVIGIIKQNEVISMGAIAQGDFRFVNNNIIIPRIHTDVSEMYNYVITNTPAEDILKIQKTAKEFNIALDTLNLKDGMDNIRDVIIQENLMSLLFLLFLLIMTSISISIIIFSITLSRKNEFGIRMAIGARINDIIRMMFGETMVILIISTIVAIVFSLLTINSRFDLTEYPSLSFRIVTPYVVIISFIIIFLMSLPALFVLKYNLKKLQVTELIKGDV